MSSAPRAVERIKSALESHGLKVVHQAELSSTEMSSRKIIESQYAALHAIAYEYPAVEINLSANESKSFRMAFGNQTWEDAVHREVVFNAVDACSLLQVDAAGLFDLWERATAKVRFRRGLYFACLDRNCAADPPMRKKLAKPIYVANGFYPYILNNYHATDISTVYFICEWDESRISWTQLLHSVIGPADPTHCPEGAIRAMLLKEWEQLGLQAAPTTADNGVHVSSSAFAGLVERLLWKKGSMLYTDLFGSRLLSARIKSTQITEWTHNPAIDGTPLLDRLVAMNSTDCINYLSKLASNAGK